MTAAEDGPAYATAVVRLVRLHENRRITAGLGMLVGRREVVTCAHVVNTALNRGGKWEQSRPGSEEEVFVEFVMVPDAPTRFGRVKVWIPPPEHGTGSGDVAGIVLTEDAPGGAATARFGQKLPAPESRLRVFGYPGAPPRRDGAWVDLDLKGVVGHQLVQVESRAGQTVRAQPGYSGSPVWDDRTGTAIGLLHAAAPSSAQTDAHILPAMQVAEAWDDQFDYLLVPDNPYRGLASFTAADADLFFGRDRDVDQLAGRVAAEPVTVVIGPSGVGKSSLVHAGLIPRLQKTAKWSVSTLRPGQEPWHRLATGLLRVQRPGDEPTLADVEAEIDRLQRDGLEPVSRFVRSLDKQLLVVVDQFEELLATGEPPDRRFVELLFPAEPVANSPVRVVITLRADYLATLLAVPGFGSRLDQRTYMLSPLPAEELRATVVDPATARGVRFEEGLVDRLVRDASGNALPLLQFTLTSLWATQRRMTLTFAGYNELGGVAGALDRFAEQQTKTLPAESVQILDQTLLHLIRTPAGAPGLTTRQRAFRSDLPSAEWQIAQLLADARLVTVTADDDDDSYAELAHEALITSWKRLNQLVKDNADFLAWLTWIEQRAAEDEHVSEARISEALRWLENRPDSVPERVKTFIGDSQTFVEARRTEQAQARIAEESRQRALQVAESLRLASEARQAISVEGETALLVAWEALLRDSNELSEAVFREALDIMPATVQSLRDADEASAVTAGFVNSRTIYIADQRNGKLTLTGVNDPDPKSFSVPGSHKLSVAVSPRGQLLTYRSGVLRLHAASGDVVQTVPVPDAENRDDFWQDVSFAENGTCLLHDRRQAWVLHVSDDTHQITVEHAFRFDPPATRATIDPSGTFLVTDGMNGSRVIETDGSVVVELEEQDSTAAACVLDDGTIVTGGTDGTGRLWARTGAHRKVFREGVYGDLDLYIRAVDTRKQHFATTTNGGHTVDVWSSTGDKKASLQGPAGKHAWSAAFSPDGSLLAVGTSDRVIRVWNWREGGDPIAVLHGHRDTVAVVAFHPTDPTLLVSSDHGGGVRLWRLGSPPVPPILGHSDEIRFLTTNAGWTVSADTRTTRAWSPGHGAVALGGTLRYMSPAASDRTAFVVVADDAQAGRLWTIEPGSPPHFSELPVDLGFTSYMERVTVAPDGQHLVHFDDNRATLRSATGTLVASVRGDDPPFVDADVRRIIGAVFHPDARRLAVAAQNGAVWVWDINGELCATFVTDQSSPDRTFDVASDPQGEFIATAVREQVGVWDWQGNRIGELNTAGYKVFRVAISLDGERILTVSDDPSGPNRPELWARDGRRLASLDRAPCSTLVVPIFDEQARYIVLPGGGGLSIMDWEGVYLARLAGPTGTMLRDSACSPGGGLIAALFDDGICRIWSVAERRRTKSLRLGDARAIAFSGDGNMLLAGSPTGQISCHALDTEDLFGAGARRISRVLERDELERFGIESPRLDTQTLQRYRGSGW